MTYFVVLCRADDMTFGYIADHRPKESACLDYWGIKREVIVGEFNTMQTAREALAMAMMRTVGPMQ